METTDMGDVRSETRGAALLEVQEIDAYYGPVKALRGVSLHVQVGEIVAVIGANGAGKTTLLRAISGVASTKKGQIVFRGRRISEMKPEDIVNLGIIQVPERRELFSSMSVLENLELGAYHRQRRHQKAEIQMDLEEVCEIFPILRARLRQTAGTLSGGEQQMLAIARGLMAKPQLLLLDEPSLGLAPLLVQEVLRIAAQLRELGCTVLLVEQNANGALQVADRAYVMEVGRVVLHGQAHELSRVDRIRRAYLGQRIAPVRRVHRSKSVPHPQKADKRVREGATVIRSQGGGQHAMISELENSLPRITLPDEYFERRASLSAEDIESIQDKRLSQEYARAFERSAFYREKFSAAGLGSGSLGGIQDLERLPFTSSDEIRPPSGSSHPSQRLMTIDQERVSLVHRSSGTTGAPKVYPYAGRDVAQWAANTALVHWIQGFRKSDIVLGIIPFGEFTGGGGHYLGFITLGLTYLPIAIGPGLTEKVAAHLAGRLKIDGREISVDPIMRANGVMCLSSFLPRLEEILDEYDLRADDLSLSKVACGGEPSSDAVRVRFAERFGFWPRDDYGLGEFFGPGVAGECEVGGGLHVLSDAHIAEVVNPETGEQTPEGEMGELVLTGLCQDAMPLFRYRTGDRTTVLPGPCPCGIAHKWIGRIPGRISADDLIIPGGVIVNRTYLENVLLQVDGAGSEYVVTVADHPTRKGLKRLYIAIEGDPDSDLARTIVRRVQVEYNAAPVVTVLPVGAIPRQQGRKARRILTSGEYWRLVEPDAAG